MALSSQSSLSGSIVSVTTSTDSLELGFNDFSVKVDRQILKKMLNGNDCSAESAQDFFVRVANESGAIITYPQLRRLDQMGKRSPEIKLMGNPVQIDLARKLIMDVMHPNKNRVTLKVDISHTDHSHIIGKGGKRIQSIMDLTETHIHFPDENRINSLEKSNLVLIAGNSLQKADEARKMVREFLPIIVSFQLEVNAGNVGLLDNSHPNIQYYQKLYNVIISFKTMDSTVLTTKNVIVQLRGTRLHADQLRDATRSVYQYLNWSSIGFNETVITIYIEIAPQNHSFVMGRANCNLKQISDRTGAVVSFPEILPNQSQFSSTVTIKGRGFESAFMAWLELMGYLPVILMFEVKPTEINGQLITSLMSNQLLRIKVCPKMNSENKNLLIKTHERNSNLLFQARQQILKIRDESTHDVCTPIISGQIRQNPERCSGLSAVYPSINFGDLEPEVMRSYQQF